MRTALIGIGFILVTFGAASAGVGQDLGSSNKLFTGKSPSSSAKKAIGPRKAPVIKSGATEFKKTAVETKKKATRPTPAPTANSRKSDPPAKKSTTRTSDGDAIKASRGVTKPIEKTSSGSNGRTDPGPTGRFKSFSTTQEPRLRAAAEAQFEGLIAEGNDARDERSYSAAETSYKRAQALKPEDARAVYGLGNLYSDQQWWEEAEKAYRSALELDSNSAVAHIALSYVLTQPIAADNLGDRYEEAERLARRAIDLDRRDPLAYDQLGVALELRGLIGPETEGAYKRAIQLDKTFAPAYAHLGRLLRRQGRLTESSDTYSTAIRLASDVPTKILVAEVMQSEQRFADSESLLASALKSDPKNPSALLGLGRALLAQSRYDEAERVIKRAIEVSPNGFTPNVMLATLYIRRGIFQSAEGSLLRALAGVSSYQKRELAQRFETLGDGYLRSGDTRSAARAFSQAVALDGGNELLSAKLASMKYR